MSEPPSVFVDALVTRGTDIDQTATVSLPVTLRYFEHLRWRVMQDERLGLGRLIDEGHFFVVRQQTIELRRRVAQGLALRLTTRFEHVGRSTARVVHEALREADGEVVARARVTGVWLGPSRRPARLPDAFREVADAQVRALPSGLVDGGEAPELIATLPGEPRSFTNPPERVFAPLSLLAEAPTTPPERFDFEHRLTVPYRDLDVFSHVNAATWLMYADDARDAAAAAGALEPDLARGFVPRVALFYQREACQGDALRVALARMPQHGPRALGVWCFRDAPEPSTEPLVSMRLDLVPGAAPVTLPAPLA